MGVELFLVQPPDDEHTSHTVVKVEQDAEEYADYDSSHGTVGMPHGPHQPIVTSLRLRYAL